MSIENKFKKILIIGCGLIGSSVLRGSITKKISKHFFVYDINDSYILLLLVEFKLVIFGKVYKSFDDIEDNNEDYYYLAFNEEGKINEERKCNLNNNLDRKYK